MKIEGLGLERVGQRNCPVARCARCKVMIDDVSRDAQLMWTEDCGDAAVICVRCIREVSSRRTVKGVPLDGVLVQLMSNLGLVGRKLTRAKEAAALMDQLP
jgi:hypothetical protein